MDVLSTSLAPGAAGTQVASLQSSLATIGFQIDQSERSSQQYGDTTQAAIRKLQALAGLPQTGTVDPATQMVIASALARLGVKPGNGGTTIAVQYAVDGYVTDGDGNRLPKATVVALDCDLRTTKELGRAVTDATGYYRITYTSASLIAGHTAADLSMEVLDATGKVTFSSGITYAAPIQTTIELAIGGPQREQPCEFTTIDSTIKPLLGSLTPGELQESGQYKDLTFLSGTTGIARTRLALYSVSARIAASTALPSQLFYALLRKNIPANATVVALASSTQGVDLDGNAQTLQQAILATDPATIQAAVTDAIAQNLLPASYAAQAPKDLATLATLAISSQLASTHGMGKTSIASVFNSVKIDATTQTTFMKLFTAATGPALRTFWTDLRNNKAFTAAEVDALHFGVTVGRLTRGYLPLINELASQWSGGKVKDITAFARLTASDWIALLNTEVDGKPIGIPPNITGSTPAQATAVYAAMLEKNFTLAYPTAAFSANLAKDTKPPFASSKDVTTYLDANPSFDLVHTNIDVFAKTAAMTPEVRGSLLSAQRLAKLNPSYTVMSTLMNDGIQSSQQIYFMGQSRFMAKYSSNTAIGATEAARMFGIAEQTYGVALAITTQFNATLADATPLAVPSPLPADAATQIAASPNLQTLFGSDSYCACEDCQSVLGAAAYLVDMLEFLKNRSASGGQNVRDVLLARRPDLAQIQLSCANTNTELPYIDLVNELLEDAVAPPTGGEAAAAALRQTTLTTPELNANPEYVNEAAYTTLSTAVYPWTLPFDLPLSEARTYLGQLGLTRVQLSNTFQQSSGYPSAQARWNAVETLGFTPVAADVITGGTLASGYQSWNYWGLAQNSNNIVDPYDPTKTVSGSWIDVLTQTRVHITRANLQYQELARLLNTRFINNNGTVTINCNPPGSCDIATMTMSGLTQDVLDRIHRFVRLWRQLGWNVYDLDDAIWTLQSGVTSGLPQLNDTLLRQLSVISTIATQYNLPVRQIVSFFGTMPTRDIPTLPGDEVQNSLYHDTFENLTVLNPMDPIFALNADGTEIAAIASNPQLADHAASLVAAFGISSSDLTLAIATFTNGALTLANLSAIYRNVQLASILSVTLTELISLLADAEAPISTAPYYEVVVPFNGARPEALPVFIAIAATIAASGMSIEQLDYVLRNVYTTGSGVAPDPVAVGTLLLTLRNGLIKIAAQTAFSPDPTGSATGKELAKLLSPADVQSTMAILAGTSTLSASAASAYIGTTLGPFMNAAAAESKLAGTSALAAGEARYEYVLQNILAYEQQTLGTGLVVQTLTQALGLATATTAQLLTAWFPSASTPGQYVISDFLALPNVALTDTSDPIAPSDPGFGGYFTTYASLTKAALLISTATLSSDDSAWWQSSGVGLGWIDPTKLPTTATAAAQGRFYSWSRLMTASNVCDSIPGNDSSFAQLFNIANGSTTKAQYFTQLEALTQWPAAALKTLCGDPANAADHGELSLIYPADYLSERALALLNPCFSILGRYGLPADVTSWIGADVTSAAADAIKQSVKANYSYTQWLTLAKQLRDPLRQNQRDALVSYLLTTPPTGVPQWLTPDDVFGQYLIDVEMCSCQATSRIVQATATVQLFVQRCFLNLENNVTVDATADADWLQWQWMNEYRLWEANREVFLFPENWIDPTLRSNISSFFSDLQQDLKQADLTNDVAETALQNYLEKLEQVARLDVCGTFHDLEEGEDILHVVARTQGSPPVYYQRQWVDSSSWTPWEQIQLDITSDHLLPIMWNGKPYLFWAIVNVKPDQNNQPIPNAQPANSPPPPPNLHLEVQLAWSQYKQSKWQPKQTAPQTLVFQGNYDSTSITLKSSIKGTGLEIDLFLDNGDGARDHSGAFILGGAGNGVEAFVADVSALADVGGPSVAGVGQLDQSMILPRITPPTDGSFDGDWIAPDPSSQKFLSSSRLRVGPMYTSYNLYGWLQSELVLQQADYYRLVTPHQTPTFDSSLPFFYRDAAREYFCVPTMYFQNGNYFTINAPAYVYHPFFKAEYRFWPFYHPFVALLVGQLNAGGVDALYARNVQLNPATVAGITPFDFASYYQPTGNVLPLADGYPQEEIDFDADDGYACYNWELFFHAPFLIAESLMNNQQFSDAQTWFEYIFNPSSATTDPVPQRYWITKPFYQMTAANYASEQIDALMQAINSDDPTLEHEVAQWRQDPFDPDSIAQLRPVAYQRAVVMKYLDLLIAWGDQLFTQDTMETINLATQFYVLAASLLGPRPQIVPPRVAPVVQTYAQLETDSIDSFSNATVVAENVIPPVRVNLPSDGTKLPTLNTLYFSIPSNSTLLGYWDTVADRLYKIRHCMNIQGVVQQLPLFSPPINPGLLVAATAAGLDIGSVLSDINAAVPPYRFATMIHQAKELCDEVRALGAELLQALQSSDAEQLSTIRSGREKQLQSAIDTVRQRQIDAATAQIDVLNKSEQAFIDRKNFYVNRSLMNDWEAAALVIEGTSLIPQAVAIALETTGTVAHALPRAQFGACGFGGSPQLSAEYGGHNVGFSAQAGAKVARVTAAVMQTSAQVSSTLGQYHQRQDDWTLQGTVATDEIARIESEKVAAEIRIDVATKEKGAQDIAVQEANDVDSFLHSKFTNQQLYDWMVGQTSTTYFQAYQLAYSIAKQAEQCFRRELAIEDTSYIQFGYWDSLHQGLTAGEKLQYDLRRLEAAYYTQNARELELTKHISLAQLDPYALVELRSNGTCIIDLPEILFDLDNPGHIVRRLKSVGVTVPCVVGPYGGVSMTLTLLDNHFRTSTDVSGGYPRNGTSDPRFVDDPGGTSEIVTSSGQNDDGLFELRFDDERYLPFEGSGAISNWRLTLNNVYPQFDYSTITDVVMHVRYTARDGGAPFGSTVTSSVKSQLNAIALAESRKGLYRMFSARHDYGMSWARFLNPGTGNDQVLTMEMPPDSFPYMTYGMDIKLTGVDVIAQTADSSDYTLVITAPGGTAQTVTFSADSTLNGVHHWSNPSLSPKPDLGHAPSLPGTTPASWTIKLKKSSASNYQSLTQSDVDDVVLIVAYQVS